MGSSVGTLPEALQARLAHQHPGRAPPGPPAQPPRALLKSLHRALQWRARRKRCEPSRISCNRQGSDAPCTARWRGPGMNKPLIQAEAFPDSVQVAKSVANALQAAERFAEPYVHWMVRDMLPAE